MPAFEFILGTILLGLCAAGGLAWLSSFAVLAAGGTLLPTMARRLVPWGFFDILLLIAVFIVATFTAVFLFMAGHDGENLTPAAAEGMLIGDAISKLITLAVMTVFFVFVRKADSVDQGWTLGPNWRNIPLGFITFVMLAPIVFAIQAALVKLGGWESKHPLIELVTEQKNVTIFALAGFATVIVAPLTEEWLFRVVLQGWLEKAFSRQATTAEILGVPESPPAIATANEPMMQAEIANPYETPRAANDVVPPPAQEAPPVSPLRTWAPIAISSAFFALAHLGHGPDFIPLFIFAVGLGLVYQRTHSIVPSLIVHACLNALSMAILGANVFK